jgi:Copine/C2 domain
MQKSDPFYEIHRRVENEDGFIDWEQVYRSKTIMDNLNPVWPEVVIDVLSLGDGNLNHPIKICIFDHEKDGNHDLLGETLVSVNRLIDSSTEGLDDFSRAIPLTMKKAKGHKTKQLHAGKLLVLEAYMRGVSDNVEEMAGVRVKTGAQMVIEKFKGKANFMDYIIGGCQLNLIFAIDFTGSNGDPLKPGTLHYLDPYGSFNDYEKSMISILNVLSLFDADNQFALWGFGAKYNGEVYNVFQCGKDRLIKGIDGILQAYRDQFRSGITMARTPTIFTDVIKTAAAHAALAGRAAEKVNQQSYTILCILTDGDVERVEETIEELDAATSTPLSVIFVGIGEESFDNMRFIDDGRQERIARDIAQFVSFNEHSKHSQKFTAEACQEVPQQLTDYYESKAIMPMPEIVMTDEDLDILEPQDKIDIELKFDEDMTPSIVSGGIDYHDLFRELSKKEDVLK